MCPFQFLFITLPLWVYTSSLVCVKIKFENQNYISRKIITSVFNFVYVHCVHRIFTIGLPLLKQTKDKQTGNCSFKILQNKIVLTCSL